MTLAVGGTLNTIALAHGGFTVFSDADLLCGRMTTDGHYILALDSYVNMQLSSFPTVNSEIFAMVLISQNFACEVS